MAKRDDPRELTESNHMQCHQCEDAEEATLRTRLTPERE